MYHSHSLPLLIIINKLFYLLQLYDNVPAQSEATLKIRVSGEAKKSFEVPINKADSRFFKFVFRGDETGEEQVSSDEILAWKD